MFFFNIWAVYRVLVKSHLSLCLQSHANLVLEVEVDKLEEFDPDLAAAVRCLWDDGGIQKCYDRRREYQLSDSTK